MKPIEFEGHNKILAKDQPQYQPLPVHVSSSGEVISCWKLSWKERWKLLLTGQLWLSQLTFNRPLQPQLPSVYKLLVVLSEENYHKKKLPTFYFTQDYSIKNQVLYIKGDEYPTYHYNFDRLDRYFRLGIISTVKPE